MTRKRLAFGIPKEVTNPGEDSRSLLFPFSMVASDLVGSPEEASATTQHRLIVTVANNRLPAWRLTDDSLIRVLFEIGRRKLKEELKNGVLPPEVRVPVSTATHSATCPYEPSRISNPLGAVIEIDEERRMGFK
jgi:hypothetical protein